MSLIKERIWLPTRPLSEAVNITSENARTTRTCRHKRVHIYDKYFVTKLCGISMETSVSKIIDRKARHKYTM